MIIKLSDGTSLNVAQSGAYYTTSTPVSAATFEGKTSRVEIGGEAYLNMQASDIQDDGGVYKFKLGGVSATAAELDDVITALFELAEIVGGING